MDLQSFYVIIHLLGFAFGAGGAFITDAIFFTSIRDRVISKTEIRFVHLGGRIVWFGITLSLISGLLMFMNDPTAYLACSKFQLKMTVFLIIILNGIIIHRIHTPMFSRLIGKKLPRHKEFRKRIPILLLSGVISTVSWLTALTLGSLRSIEYTYTQGLTLYALIIMAGVLGALIIHPRALRVFWKLK